MDKKFKFFVGVVLAAIICLQVVTLCKINKLNSEMISADAFISERIDTITSKINGIRLELDCH